MSGTLSSHVRPPLAERASVAAGEAATAVKEQELRALEKEQDAAAALAGRTFGGWTVAAAATSLVTGSAHDPPQPVATVPAPQPSEREQLAQEYAKKKAMLAEKEAKLIEAEGGKASSVFLDVRDSEAFSKLILEVKETHGRIDTLFNNAGVVSGWEVKDDPIEDWNYIVDVNIKGVMNGTLACYLILFSQELS